MAKKRDDGSPRKLRRPLPVALTEAEKSAKGEAAGHARDKVDAAKAVMKKVVGDHKAGIKALELEEAKLLKDLHAGTEDRQVDCEERIDYKRGEASIVRLDLDIVVETRTLSIEERQEGFKVPGMSAGDGEGGEEQEPPQDGSPERAALGEGEPEDVKPKGRGKKKR